MNTTTLRPPSSTRTTRVAVAAATTALLFGVCGIATQLGSDGSDQARPKPFPPPEVTRVHTL